jgi:hypothetical protein
MIFMGDRVNRLVSGHIDRVSSKGREPGRPKMVTFSLRLDEREHARLVWLAERLQTAKTPLAEGLLNAAVEEAIEQYAGWASPDDPEGFIEEVMAEVERLERRPGVGAPGRPTKKPGHHG